MMMPTKEKLDAATKETLHDAELICIKDGLIPSVVICMTMTGPLTGQARVLNFSLEPIELPDTLRCLANIIETQLKAQAAANN